MNKDIILKAENISKQYRLGQVGTGTLSHDLNRWWHEIWGKENPYLKIGDPSLRTGEAHQRPQYQRRERLRLGTARHQF